MLTLERAARAEGYRIIAGIDEAGRGPLAGPVTAAAVILPEGIGEADLPGLTDSKQLSESARERLFPLIHEKAAAVACVSVDAATIDTINILQATRLAMRQAALALALAPDLLLIDGNRAIEWEGAQKTVVKGDARSLTIAAASVVAKVTRDRLMAGYELRYPGYGFAGHKGYGAAAHREAIAALGPSPIHRRTFRGVREHCPDAQAAEGLPTSKEPPPPAQQELAGW